MTETNPTPSDAVRELVKQLATRALVQTRDGTWGLWNEEAADLIAQFVAPIEAEIDRLKGRHGSMHLDQICELKQQLSERDAQIKALRDAAEKLSKEIDGYWMNLAQGLETEISLSCLRVTEAQQGMKEALASTSPVSERKET